MQNPGDGFSSRFFGASPARRRGIEGVGRIIEVVPYDPAWPRTYEREAAAIGRALAGLTWAGHHIGSTAIPGMPAKPVIDILLAVASLDALEGREARLRAMGYRAFGEFGIPGRRFYAKGGDHRTHHVHAFEVDSPEIDRHLRFRDYMRHWREDAQAYALLKLRLATRFRDDPRGYGEAKSSFIAEVDERAPLAALIAGRCRGSAR